MKTQDGWEGERNARLSYTINHREGKEFPIYGSWVVVAGGYRWVAKTGVRNILLSRAGKCPKRGFLRDGGKTRGLGSATVQAVLEPRRPHYS